jgi:AcrR family transcriptional regulator
LNSGQLIREVLFVAARRATDQELSREMILDAARGLFVQKGFQHVSMRQIGTVLGYSHGAIYYHFKNKAELFYALVHEDFALLDEKLDDVLSQEGVNNEQRLRNVLLGFIEFGLVNQSHYEIMFLIRDEEVKSYMAQEPNSSYDKFAQAIFELTDKKTTIQAIWSAFLSLHGFVSHYLKSEQTYADVSAMAEAHVSFVMKALK